MSQNKVAVVVGGTGTIGFAVVERLLKEKCSVIIVSRGYQQINDSVNFILDNSENLSVIVGDVISNISMISCFSKIKKLYDQIDYLIYTPGIAPDTEVPLVNYSLEDWNNTFDTYVRGFFICFQECIKLMNQDGHILVVSSAVTRFNTNNLPPINAGHYAAAKAALDELTKWARRESHEKAILLSRIAPAAVESPFHLNAPTYRKPKSILSVLEVTEAIVKPLLNATEVDYDLLPSKTHSL